MRRLTPNKITMAERQIRMSLCYLRFALLMTVTHSVGGDSLLDTFTQRPLNLTMVNFIGLNWTHCDNQQRNLQVLRYNQDRNNRIPNRLPRPDQASSPACSLQGLRQSSLSVGACRSAWHRYKGRCRFAFGWFLSPFYNTRFWGSCQNRVTLTQPSTGSWPEYYLVSTNSCCCNISCSSVTSSTQSWIMV